MPLTLFDVADPEPRYIPSSEREVTTLRLYGDGRGRIPDEAAHELARDFMEIRPACAILHKQGLLRETGARRKARHRSAAELVITDKGRAMLPLLKGQAA
jgi:hypothetical protein